jgi:hypothetical protein
LLNINAYDTAGGVTIMKPPRQIYRIVGLIQNFISSTLETYLTTEHLNIYANISQNGLKEAKRTIENVLAITRD